MKRTFFFAAYVGVLAFFGGAIAERNGFFDRFIEPAPASAEIAAPARLVHYRAVLAAGDDSIPNFDNAVETLADRLQRSDVETTILTSDGRLVTNHRWYATAEVIDGVLSDVGTSDGCLVFVTSHGNEIGLVMGMDNAEGYYLTPARLADILARDCDRRPTVAILSGCHSGTFLTDAMMAENRIILTAARKDRTSFGCSTDTRFTYFDECLLDAMNDGGTWAAIFDRTKVCIERKERRKDVDSSYPQAFFGAAVRDLGIK
jgi:hypothetical protein